MPRVIKNCLVLLKNYGTNLLNKIQFESLYINMWFSLLNTFEENEFYEIKSETFNLVIL